MFAAEVKAELLAEKPYLANHPDLLEREYVPRVLAETPQIIKAHRAIIENEFQQESCKICGGEGFIRRMGGNNPPNYAGIIVGTHEQNYLEFGDVVTISGQHVPQTLVIPNPVRYFDQWGAGDDMLFSFGNYPAIPYEHGQHLLFMPEDVVAMRHGNVFVETGGNVKLEAV